MYPYPGFYVMSIHTDTNQDELWQVMSRTIIDRGAAESWKSFCEDPYADSDADSESKQEFFIVEVK